MVSGMGRVLILGWEGEGVPVLQEMDLVRVDVACATRGD